MSEWCFSNSYIYFFFTNRAVLVISKLVGFTSDDVCLFISMLYIGGVHFSGRQIMVKWASFFFHSHRLDCGEALVFISRPMRHNTLPKIQHGIVWYQVFSLLVISFVVRGKNPNKISSQSETFFCFLFFWTILLYV